MIDIIIPAYNAHKTIEQTLFSIVYQELREKIKVYLINDCSENGYKDIVTYFSNFIDIIELKLAANRGPGYARQYGIEHSYGDYIVFMDADDVLSNCYAIKELYNEIERLECDVLISNFVEEVNQNFLLRTKDTIWCHGKMYKRKFLQKYNLGFNDSRANEDNGFNQTILLTDGNIKFLDKTTYIWRNNQNSITRINNFEYRLNGLDGYLFNINWALEYGIRMNCDKYKIGSLAFKCLVYMYCNYLEYFNNEEFNKLMLKLKVIKEIYLKYPIDENKKVDIMENQYKCYYNLKTREKFLNAKVTFFDFFDLLDEVYL